MFKLAQYNRLQITGNLTIRNSFVWIVSLKNVHTQALMHEPHKYLNFGVRYPGFDS